LTMAERMGVPKLDRFGDSTGRLSDIWLGGVVGRLDEAGARGLGSFRQTIEAICGGKVRFLPRRRGFCSGCSGFGGFVLSPTDSG